MATEPEVGILPEQTINLADSISAREGRAFAGRHEYEGEKALDAALAEAKQVLPEAPSAYKPSGKTTATAVIAMLVASPVVLVLVTVICFALFVLFLKLHGGSSADGFHERRIGGLLGLVYDFALLFVIGYLPTKSISLVGRICKNRNPMLPAVFAGGIAFLTGLLFFCPLPWVEWETLASTHLSLLFIPVRWLLIATGCFLFPLGVAIHMHEKVSNQKFCEQTGVFLKPMRRLQIEFDFGENTLAILRQGQYSLLSRLPRLREAKSKRHYAEVVLWWADRAALGFLELNMNFHGRSKPVKSMTLEKSQDKNATWRAFSVQLEHDEAKALFAEFQPTL